LIKIPKIIYLSLEVDKQCLDNIDDLIK